MSLSRPGYTYDGLKPRQTLVFQPTKKWPDTGTCGTGSKAPQVFWLTLAFWLCCTASLCKWLIFRRTYSSQTGAVLSVLDVVFFPRRAPSSLHSIYPPSPMSFPLQRHPPQETPLSLCVRGSSLSPEERISSPVPRDVYYVNRHYPP